MKHQLTALIAAAALTITAAIGLTPGTAHAHNQDNNSYFGCAVLRNELPGNDNEWSVDHSWWTDMSTNIVHGRCQWHNIYTGRRACAGMSWWYPNKPGQYFDAWGVDVVGECWFNVDPH